MFVDFSRPTSFGCAFIGHRTRSRNPMDHSHHRYGSSFFPIEVQPQDDRKQIREHNLKIKRRKQTIVRIWRIFIFFHANLNELRDITTSWHEKNSCNIMKIGKYLLTLLIVPSCFDVATFLSYLYSLISELFSTFKRHWFYQTKFI